MEKDFIDQCNRDKKQKQKRLEEIWNPDQALKNKVEREKKRKEKVWNQICENQKYSMTGLEDRRSKEGRVNDKDILAEMPKLDNGTHEEQSKNVKTANNVRAENTKSSTQKVPTLNECANLLKAQVEIICVDNMLFYFNGRCYQSLDKQELLKLFRQKVSNNLYDTRSVKQFYELYSYLLSDPQIQRKCDTSKLSNIAILANGIYYIKSGKLEEFTPSIIAFSYVNANYIENVECPKFDKFLCDITGNDSVLIERLWMFLGYVFTQSLDAKAFFVMGHAPNSGKSLLGKFIGCLYEKRYVSTIALSDFNGDFSMGTLVGAAVNISLDLPSTRLSPVAVSKLKMLTGGDMITINEKYVPQFKYQNRAKFIFASNHPLKLVEEDEAFWERLVFLPFDYSIKKETQNAKLLEKILHEKDAIVSKALKYAKKLVELHYQFPTTRTIERRICEWRGIDIDTIDKFLKNCCTIDDVCKGELVEDLHLAYKRFCDIENEKAKTRTEFKKYLEQKGLEHCKMRREKTDNPKSAFRGIKLNDEYKEDLNYG